MSHNPTYDPEPGYDPYNSGNRSGHSTPPQYNYGRGTPPVTDPAHPYNNMASYRQATTGPPTNSDSAAGNGKSYRFATAEPIKEDDGDMSPEPADSKQVQFTDAGYDSKQQMGKSNNVKGGKSGSTLGNKKFLIVVILAIVFAILWVIFMGLYIRQVTMVPVDEDGGVAPTAAGVKQTKSSQPSSVTNTEQPATVPTTTQAPIPYTKLNGTYKGKAVRRYTLANNDIEVEVYTLGARLNSMKTLSPARTLVPGMNTDTTNATMVAAQTDGAWHGPVCGDNNPTLHQEHFTPEDTTDGSLQMYAIVNSVRVVFTYSISGKQLMVKVTGTPTTSGVSTKMDICSSRKYNLDGQGSEITSTHSMKIAGDQRYNNGEWTVVDGSPYDFQSTKKISTVISFTEGTFPSDTSIRTAYQLTGPTGIRQAATLSTSSSNAGLQLHTNQDVLKMDIDLNDKTYIQLQMRSFGMEPAESDEDRILLKSGSTYEFIAEYTAS